MQSVHINVNQNNWNCVKLKFLKHARLQWKRFACQCNSENAKAFDV